MNLLFRCSAAVLLAGALAACDSSQPVGPSGPVAWKQVVTPRFGFCGIESDGRLYCVLTSGAEGYVLPSQRFTALTAPRGSELCGLAADGRVYCKSVDEAQVATAAAVAAAQTFRQISGTAAYGCGITTQGRTMCWTSGGAAADVAGDPGFSYVSAASGVACGLTPDGTAYCWGDNSYGQLGDGTQVSRSSAAPVATALKFAQVETADLRACALTAAGQAFCWGNNNGYQLGVSFDARPGCSNDGTSSGATLYHCSVPTPVGTDVRFKELRLGLVSTCGLATDGTPYCWGLNVIRSLGVPDSAVVGLPVHGSCRIGGYYACTPMPVRVLGGRTFAALGPAGGFSNCAVDSQGAAWCWGAVRADGTPNVSASLSDEAAGATPPVRLREPRNTE